MRVLFVNWRDSSNPEAGGAENFTEEIGRRLVQLGHPVTIFTSSFSGSDAVSSRFGMNVIRDGGRYTVYSRARDFVKHHTAEFDIIIDEINTVPFQIHKLHQKKPVVALIHQLAREIWFYETRFPLNAIGYYLLEPRWLRAYRDVRTITVSASTREDLYNIGFKDVHTVHNGISIVPLDESPNKQSTPIIIFLGRLVKCKLPDHAIKAFEHIRSSFREAELWILGDGYLRTKLESKGIDGVRFFGRVSDREKFAALRKAHILLVPSVREGWGVSVIEANAMGTPAVGYDVPGLRDSIVDGVTGFLANRLRILGGSHYRDTIQLDEGGDSLKKCTRMVKKVHLGPSCKGVPRNIGLHHQQVVMCPTG
jgi:glycosyltransferase involved in cell wall biosynthesis